MQVVAYHYVRAFAPGAPAALNTATDGMLAVALFFLISGFVLTRSFAASQDKLAALVLARLVRLMLPCLVSFALALIWLTAGRNSAHAAANAAHSPIFYAFSFAPSAAGLWRDFSGYSLLFGFSNSCLFRVPGLLLQTSSANPVVWTINYEIWGSIWVLALVRLRQRRLWLYVGGVLASVFIMGDSRICLFTAGSVVASLYGAQPWMSRLARYGVGYILICAGLIRCFADPAGTLLNAMLLFAGVVLSSRTQRLLDLPLPQYLGRISFAIYLVHWPIMMALGSTMFLLMLPAGQVVAGVAAYAVGLAATVTLARIFERHIDLPAIRLSRRLKKDSKQALLF